MKKVKDKNKAKISGASFAREPLFLDKEQKRKNLAERISLYGHFFEGFDWVVIFIYLFFFFRLASFRWDISFIVIIVLALSQSLIYHRIFFQRIIQKNPITALKIDISFILVMLLFLAQLVGGVASPIIFVYIIILAVAAFAINPYSVFVFLLVEYLFIYFSTVIDPEIIVFTSRYYSLFFWEIVFLSLSAVLFFVLGSLYYAERKFHDKLEFFSNQLVADKVKSEAVLQSMSDGVIVVDRERKLLFLNGAAAELLKMSQNKKDKLVGRFYGDIFKFKNEDEIIDYTKECPLELAISENKSNFRRDLSLVTEYKSPLFIALSSAPVVDAAGNIQGAVAVIRDITKEKEIERMQNEFVSIASHELLTPITQVQGHLSMIMDEGIGKIDNTAEKLVGNAYSGIQRLGRLVKDLMHVSQIERETMKMNMQNVNVVEYIEDVVKSFSAQASRRKLYVKFDRPKRKVSRVNIDPDRLNEVFNNLIGNALKFTKKGGITISVAERKNNFLEISVSDTGVGIPKQEISNLFSKFYQVDSSATREAEGTGLGLYISKKMIEMMGGEIWAESGLNKGSKFLFTVKKVSKLGKAKKK